MVIQLQKSAAMLPSILAFNFPLSKLIIQDNKTLNHMA